MDVKHINEEDFEELIQKNEKVVVDFWAPWCGPCLNFAPIFESVSEEFQDVIFAKMDIDENPDFAVANNIRSIPTVKIFKNKKEVFSKPGAYDKNTFKKLVENSLK